MDRDEKIKDQQKQFVASELIFYIDVQIFKVFRSSNLNGVVPCSEMCGS
jgi:hypothetical protein